MGNKNIEMLRPSEFARRVGVHPSRLTVLKDKLNKKEIGGVWFVYVDEMNLSLFPNKEKKKRQEDPHYLQSRLEAFGYVEDCIQERDFVEIVITDGFDNKVYNLMNLYSLLNQLFKGKFNRVSKSVARENFFHIILSKK